MNSQDYTFVMLSVALFGASIIFLLAVHYPKLIKAYKWLAKELAETGKNAGAVIRH